PSTGSSMKPTTPIETSLALDIRAGAVVRAEPFPEARQPAIKLWGDFGEEVRVKPSGAQLTRRRWPEGTLGTAMPRVVTVPPRQTAGFRSEVLVLGVVNPDDPGDVVLVRPDAAGVKGWELA